MSDEQCPFCGEPRVRQCSTYDVFRCGTQGPDINGDYDIGRVCEGYTYQRLAEKDAEIERLRAALKPFADIGREISSVVYDDCDHHVNVKYLREAARAAGGEE